MPGPGSPEAYRSLWAPHKLPQPVWKNTASPGRTSWPVTARAFSASATVITSPGWSRSPPRAAATSSSRARGTTCGKGSMPAPACRPVEQQAPGPHLWQGVDADPVGAVILDDVGEEEPVVGAITH